MARIDWVVARLNNWALWSERQKAGGLGFAPSSVLLQAERVDQTREIRMPVDEIDGAVTDQAVSSLKVPHPDLHRTLVRFYLDGAGIKAIGRECEVDPSSVKARLGRADRQLANWFSDRAERQQAAKRSFTP